MKNRLLTYSILLCLCFMNTKAYASTETTDFNSSSAYSSLEKGNSLTGQIHLNSTDVKVNINGSIAEVTVRQQYENNSDCIMSSQFIFPAPKKALLHDMQMKTDEKVFKAMVKEQSTAQDEFNQFKEEGKNALLIENDTPNLLNMNLANIMPGEKVDVELKYTELLIPTDRTYEFVYPTFSDPGDKNQPESKFNIEIDISAGVPIQQVMCETHNIDTIFTADSMAKVIIKDQIKEKNNQDFILNYQLKKRKMPSGLILSRGGDENFLLLNEYVGSPGLKDITVQFTDLKTYDLEPGEIPDLSERRPVTLLAKWEGEPDGLIKVEGRRVRDDYSKTYRFVKNNNHSIRGTLKHLWAGQRIGRLLGYNGDNSNQDIKTMITNLGLKYNILTDHTSLIAYNDVVKKTVTPVEEVEHNLPYPEEELAPEPIRIAKVPEPELYLLVLIMTAVVVAGSIRRKAVRIFSCMRNR